MRLCAATIRLNNIVRQLSGKYFVNEWKLNVKPFWKLKAKIVDCNLEIKSFDPTKYIDGNLIEVKAYSKDKSKTRSTNEYDIIADKNLRSVFITKSSSESTEGSTLVILTPPAFDIDVVASGSSTISISNLESISVQAQNDHGDVILRNIKSEKIESSTGIGNIISSGNLQGNVYLKTLNGNVLAEKIQAPEAYVQTDCGLLSLRDVYSDKFTASTKTGNINIQSLHGQSKVKCGLGNINIGTIEGNTSAITEAGTVNVYAATSSPMKFLSKKGDVDVAFAEDLAISLNVKAKTILTKNVQLNSKSSNGQENCMKGSLNGGGSLIEAQAVDGSISIESSTWIKRIAEFRKLLKDLRVS